MTRQLVILGVILLGVSGWLWWSKIYNKPDTLFWRMIGNNLSTPSVTRTVESSGGQAVQQARANFGSVHVLRTQTTINQSSDAGKSMVVTETLATPTVSFVRYKNVSTTEKSSTGKPLDFSKILGIWAKQDSSSETQDALREDYIQNNLTLVPFGNLSAFQRNDLVNALKTGGAYQFDGSKVTHKTVNGKKVVVYSVILHTKKYAQVYQNFLRDSGFGELSALDPTAFSDEDTVQAEFAVDGNATLLSINFLSSDRNEQYSNFGLMAGDALPTNAIPISELQSRLQAIQ